jgi:hypothetical protein
LAVPAAVGVVTGVVLGVTIPGTIARAAPEGWLWPERMAEKMLRRDGYQAGERFL